MIAYWWAFPLLILIGLTGVTILNTLTFPRLERMNGQQTPTVSILIPARNEVDVIGQTIQTLLAQDYPHVEIILLDDESTDGTAEQARRAADNHPAGCQLSVTQGKPLPAGWLGKNWACHQLAQAASGEILIFTDADVYWEPQALSTLLTTMECYQADMLTIWPTQHTETWAERLVVPLMGFAIVGYLPEIAVRKVPWPVFAAANGQCIAMRREAYQAAGGHAAQRANVVEDMGLAYATKRIGRLVMADGSGLIRARMYRDWSEVRDGYAKNILAGHGNSTMLLALSTVFHWVLFVVPWIWLLVGWSVPGWPWVPAAMVSLGVGMRMLSAAVTGQRLQDALLMPVSVVLMTIIALRSLGTVEWKGRPINKQKVV